MNSLRRCSGFTGSALARLLFLFVVLVALSAGDRGNDGNGPLAAERLSSS